MDITIFGQDIKGKTITIGTNSFDLATLVGKNNEQITL
jgi:hypothetical protein